MTHAPASAVSLQSGDRLTPEEFDRIYALLPGVRAELIDGVVYVASPVNVNEHAEPLGNLFLAIGTYRASRPGLRSFTDGSYYTESGSRTQPDICLFRTTFLQRAWIGDDGYLRGAPEFIAEVAATSAAYDLHDKLAVYQHAGVGEYLVWRVLDRAFDFFRLEDGAYRRIDPDALSVYESVEFPGLRIDSAALIDGNVAAALAALR